MSQCDSQSVIFDNLFITSFYATKCAKIPSKTKGFKAGTETSWVTQVTKDKIEEFDFTEAVNIESIGDYTFFHCEKVKSFDLSPCTKLNYVGISAFAYCKAAVTITFPNSPLTNIKGSTFYQCISLASFHVPPNIEVLEDAFPGNDGVFGGCSNLTEVVFDGESKIKEIRIKVFLSSGITHLNIPKSLKYITGASFRISDNLESVTVETGNENYKSENGILFTKLGNLVYFPNKISTEDVADIPDGCIGIQVGAFAGTHYTSFNFPVSCKTIYNGGLSFSNAVDITIPNTIKSIGYDMCSWSRKLKTCTILANIETLPKNMFNYCEAFERFSVPSGVVTLEDNIFYHCSKLMYVWFPKTVTTFGNNIFVDCPKNIVVEFEAGSDLKYENNYLYNIDYSKLILYIGSDKNVEIKSQTSTISGGAFQNRKIQSITYQNEENILEIGDNAFMRSSLKTLTFPKNVQTISKYVCFGCNQLTTVVLPAAAICINEYAFSNCNVLSSITFNAKLEYIGDYAFSSSPILTGISLPDSVKGFGIYAFYQCPLLGNIKIPANLENISSFCFSKSGVPKIIHEGEYKVSIIGSNAFSYNNKIEIFDIDKKVTKIQDNAFSHCDKLRTVVMGDSLQEVEKFAFSYCPLLVEIKITANCPCVFFSYLTVYDSLALKDVIIAEGPNHFSFDPKGILYNKEKTVLHLYLRANNAKTLTIPGTVEEFSPYSFSSATSIQDIKVEGNGLQRISYCAFQNCTSLTHFNFPSSVNMIGDEAFNNCSLKKILIHNTKLTVINSNVFSVNNNLELVILPDGIASIASTAFAKTRSKLDLYYFGSNVILEEAGLSKSAKVYCFGDYVEDIYLGLPVRRRRNECTINSYNSRFSITITCLSIVALLC